MNDIRLPRDRAFQDHIIPADAELVGSAALVDRYGIDAPVREVCAVSDRHVSGSVRRHGEILLFDRRYRSGTSDADDLIFILRHEKLDLLVLKRILQAITPETIKQIVQATPTGTHARRIWFFYEWLTTKAVDLPDAESVTAVGALDDKQYITIKGEISSRHRVRVNLLGTPDFCPVIRKTSALHAFSKEALGEQARALIGGAGKRVVARAASFIALADSQASFKIEGERPTRNKIARWADAVVQSARNDLSIAEVERLHRLLIEDDRFVKIGLRDEGVFLGDRDIDDNPLPEFIGARAQDVENLLSGLVDASARMTEAQLDPVLHAAATSFPFVYIHPVEDGNGRLHRCLIHKILARRQFSPAGIIFPVSSVMERNIDRYRTTVQGATAPLMAFIQWRPTPKGNVEVLNDTADLYRYPDCTAEAEFLYACVKATVQIDLPYEIEYLTCHDRALVRINQVLEMPDTMVTVLIRAIQENDGQLSKRRRQSEYFNALTDDEVTTIEQIVREEFEDLPHAPAMADMS